MYADIDITCTPISLNWVTDIDKAIKFADEGSARKFVIGCDLSFYKILEVPEVDISEISRKNKDDLRFRPDAIDLKNS